MSIPAHKSFAEAFAHAIEEFADASREYHALDNDPHTFPDKVRVARERLQRARLQLVACGELIEKS